MRVSGKQTVFLDLLLRLVIFLDVTIFLYGAYEVDGFALVLEMILYEILNAFLFGGLFNIHHLLLVSFVS